MPVLDTKPDAIEVAFDRSAIVVVDMQNAFASKGGMLDIAGMYLAEAPRVVRTVRNILDAARSAGILIAFVRMAYKADLSDAGGTRSPNCYKELALSLLATRPDLKGKILTEEGWDGAVVEELAPQPEDIVITKTRYSGFAGTTLDSQLRVRGIQYLFFTGLTTNVCVESTLRDAFFLDYWPILVPDATLPAGDEKILAATVFNVESFFGWTITAENLSDTLHRHAHARARVDR
jgi:ureidoacrylate peracid hydrolase